MKWFKRILLAAALLIVIVLVIVYASLNSILRDVIQDQATASLNLTTTLASAKLSLFGGEVTLSDLAIASPPNFTAPHIFTLGGVDVSVDYGQLRSEPIHIKKISIDSPILVVEQSNMKLNLQALTEQTSQSPPTSSSGQPSQPMKLIIDELDLTNAQVNFQPGLPGLASSIQVPIPSMTLKNIGNADGSDNGAAIKDVVSQVITALAAQGMKAGNIPADLQQYLNTNVTSLENNLGQKLNGQLGNAADQLGSKLPANVGDEVKSATTQGSQQLQQGLNGLLDKNK
ncbi:MAG: hypothetical protein ABSG31_10095 [Tepidisphaeraceae bacterium]|jgi:hypothetical protein